MRTLHLYDSPPTGGATVAAQSVIDCLSPGDTHVLRPNPLSWERQGFRACGFCDPTVVREVRCKIRLTACEVLHLHSFKEFGTAAIASIYDYNCLCPRDTGYGCCELRRDRSCWRTWQPVKRRRMSLLAKLPLIGRRRRIMRWLNQLDAVICLSRHSEGLLREHGLTVPVHVVPLPIMVPEMDVKRDPDLVLFVGGDPPHKGGQVFEAAFEIVHHQRPSTRGLFLRGSTRHEVLFSIAHAACLVVPELWPNPGPVVITEALLLGTPVVASDIGGIRETTLGGRGKGTLCTPGDGKLFADGIMAVLDRNGTVKDRRFRDKESAKGRHDPARGRAQLEKVYHAV